MSISSPLQNKGGTLRDRQKADTRALILKTATSQFEQTGYRKTTIRSIAGEAGIAVGTIFSHFPDKFALLCAVLYGDLSRETTTALQTIPADRPIHEQFNHCAGYFFRYWLSKKDLAQAFFTEYSFSMSDWSQRFDNQIKGFLDYFVTRLEEMKQEGLVKSTVDCLATALSFWSHYFLVLTFGFKFGEPNIDDLMALLSEMNYQTFAGIAP